jgi:opacity protein-like surface antigen
MFKSAAIAVCTILLFASATFAGQSGDYAGISSGLLILKQRSVTDREDSTGHLYYKPGLPISAFVGHQFESGLRIDGELFYKNASIKEFRFAGQNNKFDSRAQSLGVMGNLYYNYYHRLNDIPFSPYFGLGAGIATVHLSSGSDNRFRYWNSDNDTVFAYQATLGTSIPLVKNTHLDLSYRYMGTSDITIDRIKTDLGSHTMLVGVIYYFR